MIGLYIILLTLLCVIIILIQIKLLKQNEDIIEEIDSMMEDIKKLEEKV